MSADPPVPAAAPEVVLAAEPALDDVGGLWAPERRPLVVGLVLTITLVAFEALAIATAGGGLPVREPAAHSAPVAGAR